MTELRPTHCWVRRTLYLHGEDSRTSNQVIEFEDDTEESMRNSFIEALIEFGQELQLDDYSPIRMDYGRYIIQGPIGFSVVEIDPAWTEDQIRQMEEETAPEIDWRVWGDIFSREVSS